MEEPKYNLEDHDLLIRIDEKLRLMSVDFSTFRLDNEKRLHSIEQSYITKNEVVMMKKDADSTHRDHEGRLRRLERWGSIAIGALLVIQFILNNQK